MLNSIEIKLIAEREKGRDEKVVDNHRTRSTNSQLIKMKVMGLLTTVWAIKREATAINCLVLVYRIGKDSRDHLLHGFNQVHQQDMHSRASLSCEPWISDS